jgi:hypothetical protein
MRARNNEASIRIDAIVSRTPRDRRGLHHRNGKQLECPQVVMLKTWRFVTLMLVALLLGLSFAHVLEKPAKMGYDGALYITLQKSLYVMWGPPNIGGILEPAAIVATLVLAVATRRRKHPFVLAVIALVLLLAAFPGVFFWLVAPANAAFRNATPATLPENWTAFRTQWELGHTIRFALQLLAFGCLAWPADLDRPLSSNRD